MIATIAITSTLNRQVNLAQPLDLSLPLTNQPPFASAWYVEPVAIKAVETDQFIGDVNRGGSVNFRNITFNPHGNGTHTECVGHISQAWHSINAQFTDFHCVAQVLTLQPHVLANGDQELHLPADFAPAKYVQALIIRTLPNAETKRGLNYANTNPPYLSLAMAQTLAQGHIKHFLIDLPSVDKEVDQGVLQAHHLFWNYPASPRLDRTITELIYVPDAIADGEYLLNLQVAPFENDASPSRPVLYAFL